MHYLVEFELTQKSVFSDGHISSHKSCAVSWAFLFKIISIQDCSGRSSHATDSQLYQNECRIPWKI